MSRQLKLFGLLFASMTLALVLGLMSASNASAATQAAPHEAVVAQTCDTSGTRDGSAVPTSPLPGQPITFTVMNLTPNEQVSFWFTLPNGNVLGTVRPLCCAGSDGYVRFNPAPLTDEFYQNEGRWALTVQGASSNHASVVYFCVFRQAQATQPPATATSAPSTSTSVPPTSTSVPSTATGVPSTATGVPVTETAPPAASPTVGTTVTAVASTPTTAATSVATIVASTPTSVPPPPTQVVETPAPPVPTETVVATPTVIGMPRTGQSDSTLLYISLLMGLSLLVVGVAASRNSSARNR